MKKLAFLLMTAFALLAFVPSSVQAASEKDKAPISVPIPEKSVRTPEAKALITRLDEIKAMDKSTLSPTEKRELRQEILKQLKKVTRANSPAIWQQIQSSEGYARIESQVIRRMISRRLVPAAIIPQLETELSMD